MTRHPTSTVVRPKSETRDEREGEPLAGSGLRYEAGSDTRQTVFHIVKEVTAAFYGTTVKDLTSPDKASQFFKRQRSGPVVRPRQVAMFLARELTGAPFREIGQQFGSHSASATAQAVRLVQEQFSYDDSFAIDVSAVRRQIEERLPTLGEEAKRPEKGESTRITGPAKRTPKTENKVEALPKLGLPWRKLSPEAFAALKQQGIAELRDRDHAAAVVSFSRLLEADNENLETHYFLGSALSLAKRHAEAVGILAPAIERGVRAIHGRGRDVSDEDSLFAELVSMYMHEVDLVRTRTKILPVPTPERLIADLASALNVSKEAITGALVEAALLAGPVDSSKPPKKAPERWIDRPRTSREGVIQFIERVYAPWLGQSLTRPDIRNLDLPLYRALAKHIQRHGLEINLPDQAELMTRKLRDMGVRKPSDVRVPEDRRHETSAVDEAYKLMAAAKRRTSKRPLRHSRKRGAKPIP